MSLLAGRWLVAGGWRPQLRERGQQTGRQQPTSKSETEWHQEQVMSGLTHAVTTSQTW